MDEYFQIFPQALVDEVDIPVSIDIPFDPTGAEAGIFEACLGSDVLPHGCVSVFVEAVRGIGIGHQEIQIPVETVIKEEATPTDDTQIDTIISGEVFILKVSGVDQQRVRISGTGHIDIGHCIEIEISNTNPHGINGDGGKDG